MTSARTRFELDHAIAFVTGVRQHIDGDSTLRNYTDFVSERKLPNFWSILEYGQTLDSKTKSSHEIRISRMLRWLMDPRENHKIGSALVDKIIAHCGGARLEGTAAPASHARAEYANIDVLYSDDFAQPSVFVAVEVKQHSAEHNRSGTRLSQLDYYDKKLRETWDRLHPEPVGVDRPQNIHRVFLTIDGTEAQSVSHWHPLSYSQLANMLRELLVVSNELNFVKVLNDFIDELDRCRLQAAIEVDRTDRTKKALECIDSDFLHAFITHSTAAPEADSDSVEISEEGKETADEQSEESLDVTSLVRQACALLDESFEVIRAAATEIARGRILQNHSPNENVQAFMRRLYDRLTEVPSTTKPLSEFDLDESLPLHERTRSLRSDLAQQLEGKGITVTLVLTRGKGQGINFLSEPGGEWGDNGGMGYISGDYEGTIPNDGFIMWDTKLKIGKYKVDNITSDADFESFVSKIENAILNVPAEFGAQN